MPFVLHTTSAFGARFGLPAERLCYKGTTELTPLITEQARNLRAAIVTRMAAQNHCTRGTRAGNHLPAYHCVSFLQHTLEGLITLQRFSAGAQNTIFSSSNPSTFNLQTHSTVFDEHILHGCFKRKAFTLRRFPSRPPSADSLSSFFLFWTRSYLPSPLPAWGAVSILHSGVHRRIGTGLWMW